MKCVLFFLLLLTAATAAQAQTTEDSVKAVVNLLIDGIKSSDSVKMVSAFADSAILQALWTGEKMTSFIETWPIKEFASQMKSSRPGTMDEQLGLETIRVDGPLAIVWAPYKLYVNLRLYQYGADSFQLVRSNGKWKIQYFIKTVVKYHLR